MRASFVNISSFLALRCEIFGFFPLIPSEWEKNKINVAFHQYSWNSDVEATWISLIGWPHKTSTAYSGLNVLHLNKTFNFLQSILCFWIVLIKNVNKVLPIPSLPECIICRRQLGYHSKNVDETFQNCQIIGQWLSDRNVKNGLLCMNVDFLCIKQQ